MFWYLVHNINVNIDRNITNGARNVQTLIIGGLFYIILHAFLSRKNSSLNFYLPYIWWLMLIDAISIGIIYKNYYGTSILTEVKELAIVDNKKSKKK